MTARGQAWLLAALALAACGDAGPAEDPALSGGATTVFDDGPTAFSLAARNLVGDRRDRFFAGNATFNTNWVTAPSSTTGIDGLGPIFNQASCSACHFKDGRGRPPADPDAPMVSMLMRLSVPGQDAHGGPLPEPVYGLELGSAAILGVAPEGRASIIYVEQPGQFADGVAFSLRQPSYPLHELGYGPLADGVMMSPRVAPAVFGSGLLEAVPEAQITAREDPEDRDHDGISGRANRVWEVARGAPALGRFGWKANQPSIAQQNAAAFLGDIGITSAAFPAENCSPAQTACLAAPSGGSPEVDAEKAADVSFYVHTLAVPARRELDAPDVVRGEAMFAQLHCAACHVARLTTGVSPDFPELSSQVIHPYTDLLLHDLGDGLGDGRPDNLASGNEWRTPPLWGLGLIPIVNGHSNLLHDGRARDVTEAILWHGGEAAAAREAFRTLPAADRAALVRFLGSL